MSSAGAGAEGYRASELVEFYVSLVVRALAPQPQDTGLLAQHAFHHQCGLIQDAAPEEGVGELRQRQAVLRPRGQCPPPPEAGSSSYLGLKNTRSGVEVGGALVTRAFSSPLPGETPNA